MNKIYNSMGKFHAHTAFNKELKLYYLFDINERRKQWDQS